MVPCHIDFKWLRGPVLSGQCLSFARATFLLTCLPLVHPCGDQESSSWLGSWPLMLPVDKGCLQGASRAPREGNGTPTPVLLPGKCHGWRSLVGCSPCSRRVGHDWATSVSVFPFMHWRRKWQPTPVFLPGESQGRGSLVGCRLWGRTESDTTDVT